MRFLATGVLGSILLLASPAYGDLLCIKSSGPARVIRVRPACKPNETSLGSFEALALLAGALSSQESGSTLRLTGLNLQLVSGAGSTTGPTNGRGNLIVGYNEMQEIRDRSGSHNLVVGPQHGYSSSGGFVAGFANVISGDSSVVAGGFENEASGADSTVVGGQFNVASGLDATVVGGRFNTGDGFDSAILGGVCSYTGIGAAPACESPEDELFDLQAMVVAGGFRNAATGDYAAVSGGENNVAAGTASTVGGGLARSATGDHDWRAGTLLEDN